MKLFSIDESVYDAGLKRIRYLFDEFPNVVVGYSGGKDSTVILELALIVAKEKNRLPLSVMFIDQEAEWQGTIDMVKKVMYRADIKPYWYQMPIVITNNASSYERYSYCWDINKKDEWIHPQDEISIKDNIYGCERFHNLFGAIFNTEYKGLKSCYLAGVRCEEAPKRLISCTEGLTYKDITYGKILSKENEHYTFYPIYDWSYTDVWKSIWENKWDYNCIYDEMYKLGVSTREMRISNVHHETAISSLMLIQEIEPLTWERVAKRVDGANTIKHLKSNSYICPKTLPKMFDSWGDYCIHLADNIIQKQEYKDLMFKQINKYKVIYSGRLIIDDLYKCLIKTILSSDFDFTKFDNWKLLGRVDTYRRYHNLYTKKKVPRSNWKETMLTDMSALEDNEKQIVLEHFKSLNDEHKSNSKR